MHDKYNLIVIGAGPGGYTAAIKAAQLGLNTALIEYDQIGGTCLNRGCIPTKSLIHTSQLYREMLVSERNGIHAKDIAIDVGRVYENKDEKVAALREGVQFLLNSNHVTVIKGKGTVTDYNQVTVEAEDETITLEAENILIASGSVPALPPIEGIDLPDIMTSDHILGQEGKDYKSLIIIGGGVIGVEFAAIFSAFGCQVTIIEAMDRILPNMDREISQNLTMILKKQGIIIHTSSMVEKLEKEQEGFSCNFKQKGKQLAAQAEAVLVAVGRKPNLEGLFCSKLMPVCDKGLCVNEHFMTSIPGIYAIGDVTHGSKQLAHAASAEGIFAVSYMAGVKSEINLNVVPSCVYTDPEIASVGITSSDAKEMGIPVKTGKYIMTGNGRSLIEDLGRGFIKLIFHAETEVILGASLMCGRATDLISEISTAIVNQLTIHQLGSVIRPHPTFAEGITEAVEDADGAAIHIVPKK